MVNSLVNEIKMIIESLTHLPKEQHRTFLNFVAENMQITCIMVPPVKNLDLGFRQEDSDLLDLEELLLENVRFPADISYVDLNKTEVNIKIEVSPVEWVIVRVPRKRFYTPTTHIFLSWMGGTTAVLLIISILLSKNQIRAISRLANAADRLGKGEDVTRFKLEGAREVRKAGLAFLEMKQRIERHISQRTEMLAGVSHDLRTPLTRIKLQLAMIESEVPVDGIKSNILEMEYMIKEYLDFARGDVGEALTEVNWEVFLKSILSNYDHSPAKFDFIVEDSGKSLTAFIKPKAFKRAIMNIIDNASYYGTHVVITLGLTNGSHKITIEDNGPGIPKEDKGKAFQPFYRGDSSRNLQTGGVGLGLAIAKDIINSHAGNIELGDSKLGGVIIGITVPFK
jgi:two-component system osmolarity sensor histidine kinase EnvZ